jgi:ATP-dependent DNA helicase RecQ
LLLVIIVEHDLPIVQQRFGDAILAGLPAVDTLELTPIAFPQNPYHGWSRITNCCVRAAAIRSATRSFACDSLRTSTMRSSGSHASARRRRPAFINLMTAGRDVGLLSFFTEVRRAACPSLGEVRQWLPQLFAG